MYHVKRSGKNGVKRYYKTVDAASEAHKTLERDLRQALTRGELRLYNLTLAKIARMKKYVPVGRLRV